MRIKWSNTYTFITMAGTIDHSKYYYYYYMVYAFYWLYYGDILSFIFYIINFMLSDIKIVEAVFVKIAVRILHMSSTPVTKL